MFRRPRLRLLAKPLILRIVAVLAVGCYAPCLAAPATSGCSAMALIRLNVPGIMAVRGQTLNKEQLQAFYAARGYRLAWDEDAAGLGPKAAIVVGALIAAADEGLEPQDYHVREIGALAAASTDVDRTERDFLITDGLLHYAQDVGAGRLTPQQTDERIAAPQIAGMTAFLAAVSARDSQSLALTLAGLPPSSPQYLALKAMLPKLRLLVDAGGWPPLPDGETIHPWTHDPAVPALRQRLATEGWIGLNAPPPKKNSGDLYDPTLVAAVSAFQAHHGIRPDGAIGKDTRAALDLSADARLHQAIVNMERARWNDAPATGRLVEVNLAAYALNVFQDGVAVLSMPVVVGSSDNPTPIISTKITTVVVNPNWTLPPNVIKEILPHIREDASYLTDRGIERVTEDGHVRLIQPPGPANPLGRYKFIMPNNQDIYLHDSPDGVKFHYALRAYSHGCVRLMNPAALAALLLEDRAAAMPDGLDAIVQKGETRYIALSRPVPVQLVYRTAWIDENGVLVLGRDTYGRDERLWKALHKPRVQPARRIASEAAGKAVL